jgi:hypothetical protein
LSSPDVSEFSLSHTYPLLQKVKKSWIGTPYTNKHQDKEFYSPLKIVYKLSFESLKEIARLGINVIKNVLVIDSWDSSIEAFGYMKIKIVTRVLIHIVVFIFIPLLHTIFFYQNLIHDCSKFE